MSSTNGAKSHQPMLLSVQHLAARWSVSTQTIKRMIHEGNLRTTVVGSRYRIHINEVERVEKAGMA